MVVIMSKVFVVQNQHKWHIQKEEFVPKFNLEPAEKYGKLVYLLNPTAHPFNPGHIIEELKEKLSGFTAEDHLLLVGNPILIGFAVAIASQYTHGSVSLLQWSGKDHRYIQVTTSDLFTS